MPLLSRASLHARQSDHGLHKMGAIVIRGGGVNVVAQGFNKNRTHPRSKTYNRTIHAELDAILSVYPRENIYGGDMYVVRVTKAGNFGTSKPCKDCWILLKEAGIKTVTYIDEEGKIKTQKV